MAASVSAINILFGLNSKGFDTGLRGIMGRLGGIKTMIASAFAGVGTLGGIGWAVKLAADAEMAETQMSVLLGSTAKAKSMLKELRALDVKSPFDIGQLSQAAKMLLAMGVAADKVLPSLNMISEVAMGDAFKLDRLVYAFGQISAAGKLTGQDLKQLTEAGMNPLQEISRLTGQSMDDLRKKMEAGEISTRLIELAFQSATSEGGRFYQANEKGSQTLIGQWSKLTSEARALGREIGQFLMPAVRSLIGVMRDGLEWLRSWDASQLKLSVSSATFGFTLLATMSILARIPALIKTIVAALKAMAAAQILTQSLSGPKGWAVVTASLIAAGVATGLVYDEFKKFDGELKKAAKDAKDVADATGKIGDGLPKEVLDIKQKMEVELGLAGSTKEFVAGTKAFQRALESLKPAALLKGSAEAESVINKERFGRPAVLAPVVQAVNAGNALARAGNGLLRDIRRDLQPLEAAVI